MNEICNMVFSLEIVNFCAAKYRTHAFFLGPRAQFLAGSQHATPHARSTRRAPLTHHNFRAL